jgi:hypothetical protein
MRRIEGAHPAGATTASIGIYADDPSDTYYLSSLGDPEGSLLFVKFQSGPIPEVGINGFTIEALLAICSDRLRKFQDGPFSCRENALALTKIEEGLHWLHERTRARMARGVEGTMEV